MNTGRRRSSTLVHKPPVVRVLAIITVVLFAIGCSKDATILKKDGTTIEGKIIRSDAAHVYLLTDGDHEQPPSERLDNIYVQERLSACKKEQRKRCKSNCSGSYAKRYSANKMTKCKRKCEQENFEEECRIFDFETPVARSEIADIEHPGGTASVACTVLAGGSLIMGIVGVAMFFGGIEDEGSEMGLGLVLSIGGLVIFIPTSIAAIWNLSAYSSSTLAAPQPDESDEPTITPVALSDGERTYWGIGMSWRW